MVAVTISDALRDEADEIAAALHISRSELIRNGLKREIAIARAQLRKKGVVV